jgi:hypothetical protein
MDPKKAPNVVKIGGRYYVKNNWNREGSKSRHRLNEILKSLDKRAQRCKITQCTIEGGDSVSVYQSNDFKLLLSRANTPVGFIVSGRPEVIGKERFKDAPADFEETVSKLNNVGTSGKEENSSDVD